MGSLSLQGNYDIVVTGIWCGLAVITSSLDVFRFSAAGNLRAAAQRRYSRRSRRTQKHTTTKTQMEIEDPPPHSLQRLVLYPLLSLGEGFIYVAYFLQLHVRDALGPDPGHWLQL